MRASTAHLPLFAYGTLVFDEIVLRLLDRIPDSRAGTLEDHEVRQLAGVPWPGLIEHAGSTAAGRLLDGLSLEEWELLDGYEDAYYELVIVEVLVGDIRTQAATYRVDAAIAESSLWTPEWFVTHHLEEFVSRNFS